MAAAPASIDSGRIIGRGFEALGRKFLPFLAISLALTGVPAFLGQYWLLGSVTLERASDLSVYRWGGTTLAGWLLAALLQGILVRETVMDLAGRPSRIGGSIAAGFALFLPILAISLLVGLGVVLGLVLLVVPGIVFYIMTIASIPALIEERRGVFGSIRRSIDLTRGCHLPIFVLLVLYAILATTVATVLGLLFGVRNFGWDDSDPLLSALASGLGSTVMAMTAAVMVASLYFELRTVKEGTSPDDLATIFA